jgi:hypothetical protein
LSTGGSLSDRVLFLSSLSSSIAATIFSIDHSTALAGGKYLHSRRAGEWGRQRIGPTVLSIVLVCGESMHSGGAGECGNSIFN